MPEPLQRIYKRKAMTHEKASYVKLQGHRDAKEFALAIGLTEDYNNDLQAKKDVIDKSGDSYSVKSGEKKWQIFLYGKTRFESDNTFKSMNGVGQLLLDCIESFPENFEEYTQNKIIYKNKLQVPMLQLCEKLKEKYRIAAFIEKGMFNSGEVNYLAVKHQNKFHVFWSKEITKLLSDNFAVANSQARHSGQVANQKVVFKIDQTYGEIEMRNDSEIHYREVKFWLSKKLIVPFLFVKIQKLKEYNEKVLIYGDAVKHFGHWGKT